MDLLENVLINIVFGYVWKWDILPNGRFLGEKMMNQPMPCPRKHSLSEPEGYPIGPSHAWAIKSRSWMQFNPLMKGTGRQWGYCYCRAVVPLRLRLQVRQRCFSLIISSCSIFLLGDCHHSHRGGYYGSTTRFAQPGLLKGTGSVAVLTEICARTATPKHAWLTVARTQMLIHGGRLESSHVPSIRQPCGWFRFIDPPQWLRLFINP